MVHLESYKTYRSPEQMKRIVALMHRQAVKAKSEGLFYKVRRRRRRRRLAAALPQAAH